MKETSIFSTQGRVDRARFWIATVALTAVTIAVDYAFYLMTGTYTGGIVLGLMWLPFLIRRWHDRDKSGWWALLLAVPVFGWVWTLIEAGFLPGTTGPNRFGDEPVWN
jgi:uncharacterized membrane protein YhaH (DUF805 family)